jgi:hypothetical protein
MLWQILKKAVFYEYEEGHFKNSDNLTTPRAVLIATYKYYLIRNERHECRVVLEQESWSGEFIGFCTPPLAVSQAIEIYNKMIACGANPSNIQSLGLPGKLYDKTEASLDVLENDFGILDMAEDHLPYETNVSQVGFVDGGYRPYINSSSQVSGFQTPMRTKETPNIPAVPNNRPSYFPGIPGRQISEHSFTKNSSKEVETVPLNSNIQSEYDEEEDEDISSLPIAPYLPQEEPTRYHPQSGLIQKRAPSGFHSSSYTEEDDDEEEEEENII